MSEFDQVTCIFCETNITFEKNVFGEEMVVCSECIASPRINLEQDEFNLMSNFQIEEY